MGYVRVKSGALALERSCAWAVPGAFTAPEKDNQFHCYVRHALSTSTSGAPQASCLPFTDALHPFPCALLLCAQEDGSNCEASA